MRLIFNVESGAVLWFGVLGLGCGFRVVNWKQACMQFYLW